MLNGKVYSNYVSQNIFKFKMINVTGKPDKTGIVVGQVEIPTEEIVPTMEKMAAEFLKIKEE